MQETRGRQSLPRKQRSEDGDEAAEGRRSPFCFAGMVDGLRTGGYSPAARAHPHATWRRAPMRRAGQRLPAGTFGDHLGIDTKIPMGAR